MLGNQNDSGMSIDQLENIALNLVGSICSIGSRPIDMILRPFSGSRYYSTSTVFFSTALMMALPAGAALASGIAHMIPGAQSAPPALFDIVSFSKLYFLLSLIHGVRTWRRMINMETEMHSEFEGPPLPFFRLLPKSESFWFTRIALEPAVVFLAATLLGRIFVLSSGLTTYLQAASFMLAMKQYIEWYKSWLFLRITIDAKVAGPIIARMLENTATPEDMAKIHLASFPDNLSPDIKQAALSHIARVISEDDSK
jgi:hypothetical protein